MTFFPAGVVTVKHCGPPGIVGPKRWRVIQVRGAGSATTEAQPPGDGHGLMTFDTPALAMPLAQAGAAPSASRLTFVGGPLVATFDSLGWASTNNADGLLNDRRSARSDTLGM